MKTDHIALITPNFGPKAATAELIIRWFGTRARVEWSCGIQSTHADYFVFSQFLDEDWSDKLIRRLHQEAFAWERGRPFINLPKQDLVRVKSETAAWIQSSLPEIYADATKRFLELHPVRQKIQRQHLEAGSD